MLRHGLSDLDGEDTFVAASEDVLFMLNCVLNRESNEFTNSSNYSLCTFAVTRNKLIC